MRSRRTQGGATIVEAALVLLLFITFLMAIVEFGRAYSIYQTATNAAREGARFAVAPCSALATSTSDCAYYVSASAGNVPLKPAIQTKVTTYLASNNIHLDNPDQQILVCSKNDQSDCSNLTQTGADCATPANYCTSVNGIDIYFTAVKVKAPYQFILSTFRIFGDPNGKITISSEARMRDETNN